MDFALCVPYEKGPRLKEDYARGHRHLCDPSLTTKQPMKIRRGIAEVLQLAGNRCTTKWKNLGAVCVRRGGRG